MKNDSTILLDLEYYIPDIRMRLHESKNIHDELKTSNPKSPIESL